jgi:hypothetical protein
LAHIWSNGDIDSKVEMNWQWQNFEKVKEICIGDHGDVEDVCKLH